MSLDLANGPRLEGIALLNIPSIYGGTNLWGENPSQKKRRKAQKAKKDKDKEFSTSSMSSAELAIAVQGVCGCVWVWVCVGCMCVGFHLLLIEITGCVFLHLFPKTLCAVFNLGQLVREQLVNDQLPTISADCHPFLPSFLQGIH